MNHYSTEGICTREAFINVTLYQHGAAYSQRSIVQAQLTTQVKLHDKLATPVAPTQLASNNVMHQKILSYCSRCDLRFEFVAHAHAGQYYCNSRCYQVSCATLALLKAGGAPQLHLSIQARTVLSSSLALVLPYGLALAFNLLPCDSAGRTVCLSQSAMRCLQILAAILACLKHNEPMSSELHKQEWNLCRHCCC